MTLFFFSHVKCHRVRKYSNNVVAPLMCVCLSVSVCLPETAKSVFGVTEVQGARTSEYTQGSLLFHHPGQQ